MISVSDSNVIMKYARKYKLTKVSLVGSARDGTDANDMDIGVKGLAAEAFFDFCWEVYRDLSKPVDIIDLGQENGFTRLVEKEGLVLHG